MSAVRDLAMVESVLQRLCRSMLQYLAEAFPWTNAADKDTLDQIRKLIEEEKEAAVALGQWYVRRTRSAPYTGFFPNFFSNINFVSLDHCLPMLAEHERRLVDELEGDLRELTDGESKAEVQKVLEMKKRHLKTVEALAVAHGTAAAVR